MPKFRFERTTHGWKAFAFNKTANAYVYFGHFRTQREAREVYARGEQ